MLPSGLSSPRTIEGEMKTAGEGMPGDRDAVGHILGRCTLGGNWTQLGEIPPRDVLIQQCRPQMASSSVQPFWHSSY